MHASPDGTLNEPLSNTNILSERTLVTPLELRRRYPRSARATATVEAGRTAVNRILEREDGRLLAVVGPCSIHDVDAAREYAERLQGLRTRVAERIEVVMRVYFEKPRTTIGWKGLINDPHLDDSFDIETGLATARELLVHLAELGLPTGTEALDPISPQYLADLFSWAAIGARTTESQTHREMSSGLSTAVGFKNGTDGSLEVAINAMRASSAPHAFLGIDAEGRATVLRTRGNRHGHVILRGGARPNYAAEDVALAERALTAAGLPARIMIDCSHANAGKDHARQPLVARDVAAQLAAGSTSIIGLMLESNLRAGRQTLGEPVDGKPPTLARGVSITDACIDWPTTEALLLELHDTLGTARGRAPRADGLTGGDLTRET